MLFYLEVASGVRRASFRIKQGPLQAIAKLGLASPTDVRHVYVSL